MQTCNHFKKIHDYEYLSSDPDKAVLVRRPYIVVLITIAGPIKWHNTHTNLRIERPCHTRYLHQSTIMAFRRALLWLIPVIRFRPVTWTATMSVWFLATIKGLSYLCARALQRLLLNGTCWTRNACRSHSTTNTLESTQIAARFLSVEKITSGSSDINIMIWSNETAMAPVWGRIYIEVEHFNRTGNIIKCHHRESSWCQLWRHWRHRKLSLQKKQYHQ